ncbi:MAG TPA: YbhB/YbcL family Raf kinase inhibitor-like protein [Methylibium sp.]|uniref:YbhB/YbcL family Raf kinase inhibitor-like protein n=1 Tax=Methylibium sp. TaxID=2067992 RepID=UPI002DB64872|nr:YbhB/YbcL family Raf kinase inhibitor-like protein [Methylibium sp.]HEU4459656.1 YbhB/YbcL family Raf kinase inhibitor-like protein [Methylibium sp.]
MIRRSLVSLVLLAATLAAGCAGTAGRGASGDPGHKGFSLWSPGRADNAMFEAREAGKNPSNANCTGENLLPPLAWARAPAATKSFVILMDDQAGRAGLGVNHWVAYGIRAEVSALAAGANLATPLPFIAGKNSLGLVYLGPCPPRGNAPQHYVFTLIATSLEPEALPPGLDKAAVLDALKGGKALGAASLVLRFNQ